MRELLRSNDVVLVSRVMALLEDAGIPVFLFDAHTALGVGSLDIIEQRLMVLEDDLGVAERLLAEAELIQSHRNSL